jgi:hypothetical protein
MTKQISRNYPEIIDERNEDGDTPFMLAIFKHYKDIIEFL